jgi:hypothetical protein
MMSRNSGAVSSTWLADCDVNMIRRLLAISRHTIPRMNTTLLARVRSMAGDNIGYPARENVIWGEPRFELSIPMKGRLGGLTRFELLGTALEQLVFASWDGLHLTLSRELWGILSTSSESFETLDGSTTCSEDPRIVAIKLVQSLDCLFGIEYSVWCDRSESRRSWYFEAGPTDQLVGGPIAEAGRR